MISKLALRSPFYLDIFFYYVLLKNEDQHSLFFGHLKLIKFLMESCFAILQLCSLCFLIITNDYQLQTYWWFIGSTWGSWRASVSYTTITPTHAHRCSNICTTCAHPYTYLQISTNIKPTIVTMPIYKYLQISTHAYLYKYLQISTLSHYSTYHLNVYSFSLLWFI